MSLEANSEGADILIAPGAISMPGGERVGAVSIGASGNHSWVSLGTALWGTEPTHPHPLFAIHPFISLSSWLSKGPQVVLSDSQGYAMSLGSTPLVTPGTGATEQTSAASIVMFGNDKKHHVIWQAP